MYMSYVLDFKQDRSKFWIPYLIIRYHKALNEELSESILTYRKKFSQEKNFAFFAVLNGKRELNSFLTFFELQIFFPRNFSESRKWKWWLSKKQKMKVSFEIAFIYYFCHPYIKQNLLHTLKTTQKFDPAIWAVNIWKKKILSHSHVILYGFIGAPPGMTLILRSDQMIP